MVSAKTINFEYVPSVKMVIDMLTRVVFREKHTMCMEMLGLQPSKDWSFSGSVEKKVINQLWLSNY